MDWQVFSEVLRKLDPEFCSDTLLENFRLCFSEIQDESVRAIRIEEALKWIFCSSVKLKRSTSLKKQKTDEFDTEALRVRTASGAVILAMKAEELETVERLREKVGDVLGRCVDEVKLIAFERQLEDGESCRELVTHEFAAGKGCLEVLVVTQQIPQLDPALPVLDQLEVLKAMIMSSSVEYQIDAATHLRKVLSVEANPPIDRVLELDVAPRLLELSQQMANPQLQFETLWAVLNIVSGNARQTQAIVDLDAVPIIINIMRESSTPDVQEQAIWAIGNIAGDSVQHRDLCLQSEGMPAVLQVLESTTKISCIRNAVWTISNFFRGAPKPRLDDLKPALPVLTRHLRKSSDTDVLTDALWSMSYISDGEYNYIQSVIDSGICDRLVELLAHPSQMVHTPALRTVGNLVTGDDAQTDAVLSCKPLPSVMQLTTSTKMKIRKECCWMLSNICAGPLYQVVQIRDAGFFERFVITARDPELSVRKEAAFCITNASERPEVVGDLMDADCMTVMHELMDSHDGKLQDLCLTFISNLQKALTSLSAEYSERFYAAFPIQDIEELEENAGSASIRSKAQKLIRQMQSKTSTESPEACPESPDGLDAPPESEDEDLD